MKLHRQIASRLIKLAANAMKPGFYAIYYLFPQKRYRIPASAEPLRRRNDTRRIPRIVWQTNYTDLVTLPVYANYLFNRLLASDCKFRFASDAERERFIAENYPGESMTAFRACRLEPPRQISGECLCSRSLAASISTSTPIWYGPCHA